MTTQKDTSGVPVSSSTASSALADPLHDPVALTQKLISFNTINPPGQEYACAETLRDLLDQAGFSTELHDMDPAHPGTRANLVATLGDGSGPTLGFTGHIDTVPLGSRPWSHDPFAGEIADGRLYGRGAADMKSGVACFVAAAIAEAGTLRNGPGVTLVITSGEETGCDGASALVRDGLLGRLAQPVGALVVAEPTSNKAVVGHKGALWLTARTHGVTAHGSMPEHGVNAVHKAARAIGRLADFDFNVKRHPVLGAPTLNVGTVHGGLNVNSVPDQAEIGIDIRTLPGMDHDRLREGLRGYIAEEADLDVSVDVGSVWTDPKTPWLAGAAARVSAITGAPLDVNTVAFFTDASVLTPALGGIPTMVLGPGETHMAHQTDEYCLVEKLPQAVTIYRQLMADWQAAGLAGTAS